MATEIERKFLVTSDDYKQLVSPWYVRQGYISISENKSVRVRIVGDRAFLTVKGESFGISRAEFEYEIPVDDAKEMLKNLCEYAPIEKYRYLIPFAGFQWEVDEFLGENKGLVIAEIELGSENEKFEKPTWIGDEVTGDDRYYNVNLNRNPFRNW